MGAMPTMGQSPDSLCHVRTWRGQLSGAKKQILAENRSCRHLDRGRPASKPERSARRHSPELRSKASGLARSARPGSGPSPLLRTPQDQLVHVRKEPAGPWRGSHGMRESCSGESASFRYAVSPSVSVVYASAYYDFYVFSQNDLTVSCAGVLHNYLPRYLIVSCSRKWCHF